MDKDIPQSRGTTAAHEMTAGKHPRKKRQHPRSGRIMLWILLGLAVCCIMFMILLYPVIMVGAPSTAAIRIPAHATENNVSDTLSKYFGESYTGKVMRLIRLRDTDFSRRHGLYVIEEGTNALAAMRRLTSGAQTPVRITINGFRSLDLLTDRVSRKMDFPADSLRAALSDAKLTEEYGLKPSEALALFVDDTYEVFWTMSPRELIARIGENYRKLWNTENIRKGATLGMTPAGIMTIASIADEETNKADEKGTIGRLYINRLHRGMRLQADPTVRFAVGDFTIKRVTKSDLRTESPYNTYLHSGLPPGPIRTTSAETVKRILDSSPNDYLYMCAKEDFSGTHNFATSYEEHLRNATRYQEALDRRGITR